MLHGRGIIFKNSYLSGIAISSTPLSCGCKPTKGKHKRKFNPHYTDDSFRRAIHRACDRVFIPASPLCREPGESNAARMPRLTDEQKTELKKWQADQRWSPQPAPAHDGDGNPQEIRNPKAAATALGHSRINTSELYAERDLGLASQIASELG